jgi:hypothetical protein
MRQWVLERLDAEGKLSPEATSFHKAIVLAVTEALKSLKLNTQDDKEEAQRRQNEVIISQLLPSLQLLVEDINEMESAPAPDPLIRNLGERGTRILDLMEALKASVEATRAQEEPSEESRESA